MRGRSPAKIMVFGLFAILTAFQKPKWLDTCMEKLYAKASQNMMRLRSMSSGPNGKRNEVEMKDFVNPMYKKNIQKHHVNPLVRRPKSKKQASRKSAHEVVGISRKDFAKRKRAATRDRKQGRGASWLKQHDESTGDSYYVSESTGETAWEVPDGAVIVTKDADGHTSFQRQSVWEEAQDEETGQVYYYHKETGETSWEKPAGVGERRK